MKIVEYSKGSITEVENVFKVVESGAQGPPGETGPAGTTDHLSLSNIGTNTHAQIDTHIENSVLASDIFINRYSLWAACDGFRKLETTATVGPFYVGVTGYGDSMANVNNYTLYVLTRALQMRYGCGGLFTPNLGQTWSAAAFAFGGGAAQDVADFTYFPGSNQISMPSGSTASITTGQLRQSSAYQDDGAFPSAWEQFDAENTANFKTVRCFYLKRPGDGTLTFTVSQPETSGYAPVPVSCDASLELAYIDIDVLDPSLRVTLLTEASGAGCVFVGAVFMRESGVLAWNSQSGGSTMEQQKTYIENGNVSGVYTQLCEALSTALFIHAQRVPGDANWEINYAQLFAALADIDATSQLVLGEPPVVGVSNPTIATINTFLYNTCISDGYAFIDQNKALGSDDAILISLGWGDGDAVHLDAPAHRFLSSQILSIVDWFRMGSNQVDAHPLTMHQLVRDRLRIEAPAMAQSSIITGRAESTMDGTVTSGGFSFNPDNTRGFSLWGAAALGYVAGRPGIIPAFQTIPSTTLSIAIAFTGYRNLDLSAGTRGFAVIGANQSWTSLAALNNRSFGFEAALGSDVGSPDGTSDEVVRLFASDGTTTTYSRWVAAASAGVATTPSSGFNIAILWDKEAEMFFLYRASLGIFKLVATLSFPFLATTNCTAVSISLTVAAEDAGNIPAAPGFMSFSGIKAQWSRQGTEYGLLNNGMITNY